jgi:hypothetical protein
MTAFGSLALKEKDEIETKFDKATYSMSPWSNLQGKEESYIKIYFWTIFYTTKLRSLLNMNGGSQTQTQRQYFKTA